MENLSAEANAGLQAAADIPLSTFSEILTMTFAVLTKSEGADESVLLSTLRPSSHAVL